MLLSLRCNLPCFCQLALKHNLQYFVQVLLKSKSKDSSCPEYLNYIPLQAHSQTSCKSELKHIYWSLLFFSYSIISASWLIFSVFFCSSLCINVIPFSSLVIFLLCSISCIYFFFNYYFKKSSYFSIFSWIFWFYSVISRKFFKESANSIFCILNSSFCFLWKKFYI